MYENRWTKRALGLYFAIFLVFIYGPIIVMAILSFTGGTKVTFPLDGTSLQWWQALYDESIPLSKAAKVRPAAIQSLYLALVVGAVTAILALTLSMAFRRRFKLDGVLFFLILLCLMTPGFLLSLGTAFFWRAVGEPLNVGVWQTALGTNTIWALPFGFLVMLAVWNRYDKHVEEAARDLGADAKTTFREVTLPLIWTGIFGCFLFGFLLSWNEYDRTALVLASGQSTLPIQVFALTVGSVIQPDLYALGTATTAVTLLIVLVAVAVAMIRLKRRKGVSLEQQVQEELGQVEELHVGGAGDDDTAAGAGRAR